MLSARQIATQGLSGGVLAGRLVAMQGLAPFGIGGGSSTSEARKRYIQRVGNRLVTFSSAAAAIEALEAETARKATTQPVEIEAPADEPLPEAVPVAQIKRAAKAWGEEKKVLALFRQRDFGEILALYRVMQQWQDEEDTEVLLMAIA